MNWRLGNELETSALANLRKCHMNNSNNNNKVTLRPCELQELTGKKKGKKEGRKKKERGKRNGKRKCKKKTTNSLGD